MSPSGTPKHRVPGCKPVTCLSSDFHDGEEITDRVTHYMGCIEFCDRESFYNNLPEEYQHPIKLELRRISFIRRVIENTQSDDTQSDERVAKQLVDSLLSWQKDNRANIKKVADWSAHWFPRRANARHHDPNSDRQVREGKPDEYIPDKDFNAYFIEFSGTRGLTDESKRDDGSRVYKGKFPNQKISVDDLLHDANVNPLRKQTPAKGQPKKIRYFHLPANNMKWVEEAIARYYDEENPQYDTRYRKNQTHTPASMLLRRDFWRGQEQGRGSPIIHTRHLRPLCEPVSSDPDKVESRPRNIVLFMPYLHWDFDHQRGHFSSFTDRPPKDPPEAIFKRLDREPSSRFRHITPQWPRRDANGRLLTKNKLGQLLYDAFKLFEAINNYRDRKLIESYLLEDPPLHPRRTLDQSYYWTLRNTKARDRDQVVYRGTSANQEILHRYDPDAPEGQGWSCNKDGNSNARNSSDFHKPQSSYDIGRPSQTSEMILSMSDSFQALRGTSSREPELPLTELHPPSNHKPERDQAPDNEKCLNCQEAIRKVPRLIMVDQLWMWILDDCTILTAFPKRYGVNRQDTSGVHKAIRQRLGLARNNHIRSAYDVALIVIDECSSLFFDRTKTDERQPQVVEIFSEAIGNMAQKQTISSSHLWHWTNELAKASHKKSSLVDLTALHTALLNITQEGKLQRETKDIIEELDIMIHISRKQRELLKRFKKHAEILLDPQGTFKSGLDPTTTKDTNEEYEQWKWFRGNAEEVLQEVEDHLDELSGLHKSAEDVCKSLDSLLSLKQQQASAVQAWQSIRHGEEAVKQGRAIMIFTVITIIFLPLAFMTGILDLYNEKHENNRATFREQLTLIFTVSFGVICLVVIIAFSNFLRAVTWSIVHFVLYWVLVKTGIYGQWVRIPDKLRADTMVQWAEREVNEMKDKVKKERRRYLAQQYERRKEELAKKQEEDNRQASPQVVLLTETRAPPKDGPRDDASGNTSSPPRPRGVNSSPSQTDVEP
ncbi:hypothetical protein S40293_05549 [Stachybotrys chartarum IBT 40293]|nr:hypothetical protein S40293_05549 [Stachybotrys chartarum IBT 40293]